MLDEELAVVLACAGVFFAALSICLALLGL